MKKASLKITNSNRFNFVINSILMALFSIVALSCSNDDNLPAPVITELSEEIKNLIYFNGDEKATTVLIQAQAGPAPRLDTEIVDLIVESFDTTDLLTVNVHQSQTLTPSILQGDDITLDQAVNFNTESIEMLSKVVTYFKDQGRTVYVFGYSFGAFVTQDLIAKKGIAIADKYLIISGRLDMNDIIWEASAEGMEGYFENGVTPKVKADLSPNEVERNLNRISAEFAKNRYTQLLNTIEDLSNITYAYGTTDEAVGSLTAEEVQFLESKNTNILAGDGNHSDTFWEFVGQGFKETFDLE